MRTLGENAQKKNEPVKWETVHKEAFMKLKQLCTETPILAYADYSKPFILNTDASGLGLAAILYQNQDDGTKRPVAYASRSLKQSKSKYPAHKLEFLAFKWAVTDRFHEYLYGGKLQVYTDNNVHSDQC